MSDKREFPTDQDETAQRLIELVQADKEGRLVVLPCKVVGDTLYRYHNEIMSESAIDEILIKKGKIYVRWQNHYSDFWIPSVGIGKWFFLSKEEAVAAPDIPAQMDDDIRELCAGGKICALIRDTVMRQRE